MAIADFRDIVMVAGEDPYAYKGTDDIHRPACTQIRADLESELARRQDHYVDEP